MEEKRGEASRWVSENFSEEANFNCLRQFEPKIIHCEMLWLGIHWDFLVLYRIFEYKVRLNKRYRSFPAYEILASFLEISVLKNNFENRAMYVRKIFKTTSSMISSSRIFRII